MMAIGATTVGSGAADSTGRVGMTTTTGGATGPWGGMTTTGGATAIGLLIV
jgi:hypothetical protein